MGDRLLRADVLGLFRQQLVEARDELAMVAMSDVSSRAHGLKGAAQALGAFRIAQCAQSLEEAPTDIGKVAALIAALEDGLAEIDVMTGDIDAPRLD